MRTAPTARLQKAQWTPGWHLLTRAVRATRRPPHTFLEADTTTLPTLCINGADMMDTLDRAMMTFDLGECTEANVYVAKGTVEMTFLVMYDIVDAFPASNATDLHRAPIAKCRSAATPGKHVGTRRSGLYDLVVGPRAPRERAPVEEPPARMKRTLRTTAARPAGTATLSGASGRPRIRRTPPTRLRKAQSALGRHLRARAS